MSRSRKTFLLILVSICLLARNPLAGHTQGNVEVNVETQPPEYSFGEGIQFQAKLQSSESVDEVLLLIQNGPGDEVQIFPASLDSEGNIKADIDLTKNPMRAFSTVNFWFQINLHNGDSYTSDTNNFPYLDNRFDWKMIENPPLRVHWYSGDLTFAQEVLNTAQAGIQRGQQILPQVLTPSAIDIYVYATGDELRDTLLASNQKWIAGHADPGQNLVLVSLPPGPDQRLEMERQIPHELMHIMLYYTDKNAYANLPAWFNEGLASMTELYPNPDYPVLLQNAYETNSLLPLKNLCQVFPSDSHEALLAYAESAGFLNFLSEEYGNVGFERLMALYAQGQGCEQAIETGFRASLSRLESQWHRQSFAPNSMQTAIADLLPWLILLIAVLAGPLLLTINMIRHRNERVEL